MSMFIPLKKVDAAQRLVFGRIDETPDRAGEVFDYASSKPYFQAWSDGIRKASGGKSLGNVRAMHSAVAAGLLEGLEFDDAAKCITLRARIVDEAEWNKVAQGVYTGFSPGGRYVERWADGDHTRYTAQPSEVSIVDLPCIPSASFTMVKADGVTEQRGFAPETLAKAGARNSQADLDMIQQMHDTAVALGAQCSACADAAGDAADDASDDLNSEDGGDSLKMAKRHRQLSDQLAKAQAQLMQLSAERADMQTRLTALERRPMAGGPALRAVTKGEDLGYGDASSLSGEDDLSKLETPEARRSRSLALIKQAHKRPIFG